MESLLPAHQCPSYIEGFERRQHPHFAVQKPKSEFGLLCGGHWICSMIAVLLVACASQSARAGGVTVITHGYESPYFGYPGWVDTMADQIAAAAEAKGQTTSRYHLVIGHTLLAGPYQTLDATSSNLASDADEVIVTVDWAAWADHLDPAYGSHANTADIAAILATDLLATLPSRGISSPLASRPLHLIGHSRGASVMMETARILGSSGSEPERPGKFAVFPACPAAIQPHSAT